MVEVSVIVTTYNWPEALKMVLQGLNAQSYSNFEVIVADDGSTHETKALIEQMTGAVSYSLSHVWHEDKGFRAAAIRNRAAARAAGKLLIFLDGDSVPFSNFVEKYVRFSEKGFFTSGNRILFSRSFTARVIHETLPVFGWGLTMWVKAWLNRDIKRLLPLFSLPDGWFRKLHTHKWRGVRTCNMACWKSDFYQVNGFDESFEGWGREDSDLAIRLINSGVLRKDVRYAIPILHLWHQENDRAQLEENDERLNKTIALNKTKADVGVDRYRASA